MQQFKKTLFPSKWSKGWSFYVDEPPPTPPTPPPPPPPPPPDGKFTQSDVDRFLAEDRRKHNAKQAELTKQLEQLQTSSRLTQEEKDGLAAQIEEIKNASLTKEQQLARDLEKKEGALKLTTETLTKERDSWQQRYGTLLVTNEITKASVTHKAFSPTQMQDLLLPRAKVVERKDTDGKGTGEFEVLIKFEDVDPKTKQPVLLELPPEETVKRMKELPDRFGNLFESGIQGGVGKTKSGGAAGEPDVTTMTPEQYREYRKTRKLK